MVLAVYTSFHSQFKATFPAPVPSPPPTVAIPFIHSGAARLKKPTTNHGEVEYNFFGGHRRSSAVYTFWSSGDLVSSAFPRAFPTSFFQFLIIDNYKQKHLEISISCTLRLHVKKKTIPKHWKNFSSMTDSTRCSEKENHTLTMYVITI